MKARMCSCLLWIGSLVAGGCGPDTSKLPATVDAQGIVTLDGKAVDGAQVVFVPADGAGTGAYGATDSSGKFSLRAFEQKDGAIPGKYRVQISKTVEVKLPGPGPDGGENVRFDFAVPARYTGVETSGLTFEIPKNGTRDINLSLSSGGDTPAPAP